jgi:hypothetical protein
MGKETTEYCSLSERVDGKLHSWHFDGDDPYVVCSYCGEARDALNGRVIKPGRILIERKPNYANETMEDIWWDTL